MNAEGGHCGEVEAVGEGRGRGYKGQVGEKRSLWSFELTSVPWFATRRAVKVAQYIQTICISNLIARIFRIDFWYSPKCT